MFSSASRPTSVATTTSRSRIRHSAIRRWTAAVISLVALVAVGGVQAPSASAAPGDFTNYTFGNDAVMGVYVLDDTIYAATSGGGLFISGDGGTSWTSPTSGPSPWMNGVFATNGAPYDTVYAATEDGLYVSADGGDTFNQSSLTVDTPAVYAIDGAPDDTVYAATYGGLYVSDDGGSNWTHYTTADGLGSDTVLGVYAIGSTIYAATMSIGSPPTGGGLSISTDGGDTWTTHTTADGLRSNFVRGVYAIDSTIYAATYGGASISTDGGDTWTTYTTADGLGSDTVQGVYAIDSTIYAATANGLSISDDGGSNWTTYTTADGLGSNTVYSVYASGGTVYAATQDGLSIEASPPTVVPVTLTCDGDVKFYASIDDTIVFNIASPCNLASDSADGIWNVGDNVSGFLELKDAVNPCGAPSTPTPPGDWYCYRSSFPVTTTLGNVNSASTPLAVGDVVAGVMVGDNWGSDIIWMGPPTGRPGPLTFSPDTASPPVTTFDDTPVVGGTPATQAITVRNTGDDTATPSAITTSGTGVSVTGGTCGSGTPIAQGGTCTVNIAWAPVAAGALSGSALQISYSGGRDDSTTLTGTATAAPSPPPSPPRPAPAPAMTPPSQAITGTAGTPITATSTFTVENFTLVPRYTVYPALPTGLTIDPATGIVSGTPAGAYPSTRHWITATAGGNSESASSTLQVTINPAPEPPPPPTPTPAITIVGSRSANGTRIDITGTSTHLTGATLAPWFQLAGQATYTRGKTLVTVASDGTFTWSRKSPRRTHVYFTHDTITSNTVVIAAR